jgi:Zn-finger nucleic acid-binding protein
MAALTEMVIAADPEADDPGAALQPAGRASSRRCPTCAVALAEARLFGVAVEHCAAHGVWFDGGELERSLHGAATTFYRRYRPEDDRSTTSFLRAVFQRWRRGF